MFDFQRGIGFIHTFIPGKYIMKIAIVYADAFIKRNKRLI